MNFCLEQNQENIFCQLPTKKYCGIVPQHYSDSYVSKLTKINKLHVSIVIGKFSNLLGSLLVLRCSSVSYDLKGNQHYRWLSRLSLHIPIHQVIQHKEQVAIRSNYGEDLKKINKHINTNTHCCLASLQIIGYLN